MTLVLDFGERACADPAQTGGKGAKLAELCQAGFPVPPGFCITTTAYRAFVADQAWLPDAIAAFEPERPDRLAAQCELLRRRLESVPLPEALETALAAPLAALLAEGPVSVRSSSTFEDLAGAAFAGQHDTILNVATRADVHGAVARVMASLWQDRAVRYRLETALADARATMAVVVQRMVAADVAGVGFGLHPITGDTRQILISAAWGLGETVVSGEGETDQVVLAKADGSILEQTIGDKTHRLVGTAEGVARVAVAEADRARCCLAEPELQALAGLQRGVESHFGFPQDIEWAFASDRLYLLQSRPVTRLPERWTRDESAERFPNPVTPLSWDFASEGFQRALGHSLAMLGLPPFKGHWFQAFDGYVYGNQTAVEVFSRGDSLAFSTLDALRALLPAVRRRYQWVLELPMAWTRDLDRYLLRLGAFEAEPVDTLDERELWRTILAIDGAGQDYFKPNIAISIAHGMIHRMLFRVLAVGFGQRAAELHDALTCFCETKTSLVNRDLGCLAAAARAKPRIEAALAGRDRRRFVENDGLAAFPVFQAALARFLEDHGHREVDWDAYHPTWSGQPWVVLDAVALMLARGPLVDQGEREHALRWRQYQAERDVVSALPDDLGPFVSELIRMARTYTALDDIEHYQTTRLYRPFRRAIVALGARFVPDVIDAPDDIFFLRKSTLEALVERRTTVAVARAEAMAAKAEHARQQSTEPPWDLTARATVPAETGSQVLRGVPGAAGRAEGPVAIVRSTDDFASFPRAAVLVARTTNPAWTPLFYAAIAVVTESGGPLSHGAVTAREVGVPAVMAVRGVLGHLRQGMRVRVDGGAGIVEILD